MKKIIINFPALALYAFGTIIFYLAGKIFGKYILFFYYLLLLFPIFSLLQLVIAYFSLRYFQNFSNEHPKKGEILIYNLAFSNPSFLSNISTFIKFKTITPDRTSHLPDLELFLKKHASISKQYTIACAYRGIYTVGFEFIKLRDLLGWIKLFPEVWQRTFYVYPRVIDIFTTSANKQGLSFSNSFLKGLISDNTLFNDLKEYQSGQPIRDIAWKKFFSSGKPYLKTYDKTSWTGINILIDLRRNEAPDPTILQREDCSVEILVALVKFFLKNQIPLTINAIGKTDYYFSANSSANFSEFYKSTVDIIFGGNISPALLFKNKKENSMSDKSILFITHKNDPLIFELIEEATLNNLNMAMIINQTNMNKKELTRSNKLYYSLNQQENKVLLVNGPHSIKEDLEK